MAEESETLEDNLIDVTRYRSIVNQFMDLRRFQSALFWAEKVCVLSQNKPRDVYIQAQCMFLLREYHRTAHVIRLHELEKSNISCYYLLLESLFKAREFNEAMGVINTVDVNLLASSLTTQSQYGAGSTSEIPSMCDDIGKNEMFAAINLIKGKIYEAMDNRGLAMDFYVEALHKSVYSYEALDALVQHEMLMAWEEKELMEHLPLRLQSSKPDAKLIKTLYESKLKKYYQTLDALSTTEQGPIGSLATLKSINEFTENILKKRTETNLQKSLNTTNSQIVSPANKVLQDLKNTPFSLQLSLTRASSLAGDAEQSTLGRTARSSHTKTDQPHTLPLRTCLIRIQNSTDVIVAEAEKMFYDYEYKKCYRVLTELLHIDPYHNSALTVQIGCLMEFGDYNKLFYVAHKLVDRYPNKAISWYAVGCYYDLIGKSDPARRYLAKATALDKLYGPAWLAYGHSFAKENEHDQAMAAYFKATQLMRGCHLPLLYIGVECGLTKNLELAEKFFYQAMSIAPLDVFVLHELGVIKYEYDYFESAEEVFRTTAEIITNRAKQNKEEISARWEPLFTNLGHTCRKTKKYTEALEFHQFALLLKPQNPLTYTAIGFIHALMGDLEEAITYFHKSLALNRDCIVTATILKTCVEDLMDEDSIIDDICGKDRSNESTSMLSMKSPSKRMPPIEESPMKFNCIQLKYDEDDEEISTNSDNVDTNLIMDISMDL